MQILQSIEFYARIYPEMINKLKYIFEFGRGFVILISFYFISYIIVSFFKIPIPPAILGLILFAFALIQGLVKEKWVELVCNFMLKNMAMFLVPFVGGLIVYKSLLAKNWMVIFLVIFITTTLVITVTGLFVEYGLKGVNAAGVNEAGVKLRTTRLKEKND